MIKRTVLQKFGQLVAISTAGTAGFTMICLYKGDRQFYSDRFLPTMFKVFDGETAHEMTIWAAKNKLLPRYPIKQTVTDLTTEFCGIKLDHPVGLAAGLDKNAEAIDGLQHMGFSFVEVGSVTPEPQPGNHGKRVFRLVEDQAVINRYGFNSLGHEIVRKNIEELRNDTSRKFIIGVNLGKNKLAKDAVSDYVKGVTIFCNLADYLVINISSPNTPGLRNLQNRSELTSLIQAVLQERNRIQSSQKKTPLLIKIAPDLNSQDLEEIADVILNNPECAIDGLIVSNTTVSRPSTLTSENKNEVGGLSGEPLGNLSSRTIYEMYKLTKGKIPIIGVGGISTGEDAYEKIKLGASCVQVYTALVYQGPPLISSICKELDKNLQKDGFQSVKEAIGAAHK